MRKKWTPPWSKTGKRPVTKYKIVNMVNNHFKASPLTPSLWMIIRENPTRLTETAASPRNPPNKNGIRQKSVSFHHPLKKEYTHQDPSANNRQGRGLHPRSNVPVTVLR